MERMTLTPPFPLAITMSHYNTTTKVDPARGITLEIMQIIKTWHIDQVYVYTRSALDIVEEVSNYLGVAMYLV